MADNWYRLQLKLDAFDESPFVASLTRNRAAGIRFESFASLGDSHDNRRRLYELNRACSRDIPNRGEFYTFEDYVAQRMDTPYFRADGITIALDGEDWIGMCALSDHLDEGYLFVDMTGVRAEYRQRGISLAMKVLALRWARSVGATSIRTFHDRENKPAIRANEKLGFVPA
jgi:RimJ/RimL family protein N-acetyltransferase